MSSLGCSSKLTRTRLISELIPGCWGWLICDGLGWKVWDNFGLFYVSLILQKAILVFTWWHKVLRERSHVEDLWDLGSELATGITVIMWFFLHRLLKASHKLLQKQSGETWFHLLMGISWPFLWSTTRGGHVGKIIMWFFF